MKIRTLALIPALLVVLALSACGGDDSPDPPPQPAAEGEAPAEDARPAAAEEGNAMAPEGEENTMVESPGVEIVIADSEFGPVVKDSADQAIYIFENDEPGESNCYGECAAAWPPVLTEGEPVAAAGADQSLLATTKRDDGSLQVTYDDQPLYYYAHEAPGEVRCHNVELNGGFWWVIGPDGERRP